MSEQKIEPCANCGTRQRRITMLNYFDKWFCSLVCLKSSRRRKMLKVLTITACLIGSVAAAQEVSDPHVMFVRGGVLCDTQEDLEVLLTGISLADGNYPDEIPASCGRFVPERPVPMTVTPLYWYEVPMVNTLVARFVFEPNNWVQYGWIAYEPNLDYVPPEDDGA